MDHKVQINQHSARQTLEIEFGPKESQLRTKFNKNDQFSVVRYHNVCALMGRLVLLCISTMYFGYSLTYYSAVNLNANILPSVFGTQVTKASVNGGMLGCITLGAAVGALISPVIMMFINSRRIYVLIFNLIAVILGGVIEIPNIEALFVCRILQGFCFGNYMAIIPIYINQMVPKQLIGTLGVLTQLGAVTGVTFCYMLGLIFFETGLENAVYWRLLFILFDVFIIGQTIMFFVGYIPQSPNSLIIDGKQEQAKKVIGMFTKEEFVEEIYRQKLKEIQLNGKKIKNSNRSNSLYSEGQKQKPINYSWKAILIGFNLPLMQQFTGINAIVTQASTLVNDANLQAYVPFIINAVQLLSTVACLGILLVMGRRPNTLYGNLGLAIIDIILGIVFIFKGWTPGDYINIILLILYMIVYGTSLGPVVWLYVPEILPPKLVPIATFFNWIGCSICIIFLPIVTHANNGNPYPAFFFFGGWTFLAFLVNYKWMVETKGLTSQQIVIKFHES